MMELKRIASRNDGTFGVLLDNGFPFAVTAERPWLDNMIGKSCIPAGEYVCRRVDSPKFGNTWEVTGVRGRTQILFHKGNIEDDSRGCILVGESFGIWSDGRCMIERSGDGFMEFLHRTSRIMTFDLSVTDAERTFV